MKNEKQRIAMAELDGFRRIRMSRGSPFSDDDECQSSYNDYCGSPKGEALTYEVPLPYYVTLDDCQRVFISLSDELKRETWRHVNVLTYAATNKTVLPFEATPEQWREAILRATGKWEDDEA